MARAAETRRRIADSSANIHRLYRRAEGVVGHLLRVPVPEVEPSQTESEKPEIRCLDRKSLRAEPFFQNCAHYSEMFGSPCYRQRLEIIDDQVMAVVRGDDQD